MLPGRIALKRGVWSNWACGFGRVNVWTPSVWKKAGNKLKSCVPYFRIFRTGFVKTDMWLLFDYYLDFRISTAKILFFVQPEIFPFKIKSSEKSSKFRDPIFAFVLSCPTRLLFHTIGMHWPNVLRKMWAILAGHHSAIYIFFADSFDASFPLHAF